jgi:hypothetical protein
VAAALLLGLGAVDGEGATGDSDGTGGDGLDAAATAPGAVAAEVVCTGCEASGVVTAETVGVGVGPALEQTPAGEGGGPPPDPLCGM